MLVLTRKLDEKIRIGENITITLLRVQGNTVRLGIEAPRDIRVIRGELEAIENVLEEESDCETLEDDIPMREREEAFAHPVVKPRSGASRREQSCVNRINNIPTPQVFTTRAAPSDRKPRRPGAPLAAFLSTQA